MSKTNLYKGELLKEEVKLLDPESNVLDIIPPYIPSRKLIKAIEYAFLLERPLLLRGEPGCGKTRLAQAVAYELYKDRYKEKYFEWYVKSTTTANEGLYKFDHIGRLRDSQFQEKKDIKSYRTFGPLGNAFINSVPNEPSILLIDEVDKANIDFPNDLLLELEQKKMFIPETGEEIVAKVSPIVFITSNDEKELPDAFLRRCIFFYIDFPNTEQLKHIINAHLDGFLKKPDYNKRITEEIVVKLIDRFNLTREKMKSSQADKKPSTSEVLDWIKLIQYYYDSATDQFNPDELEQETLPYAEVLLKTLNDHKKYSNTLQ